MKRLVYLGITLTVILTLIGCTTKSLLTNIEGQWDLETISNESGEIVSVGKSYHDYEDWDGQKKDIKIAFNKDNTFETVGLWENSIGKYSKNQDLSTGDTTVINMNVGNGTEITATHGIRQYQDGEKVGSLIFTADKKIYSFFISAVKPPDLSVGI